MLNCYLHDRSLHARAEGIFTDDEPNSGYGYVTDKLKSYFKTPTTLMDPRSTRLDLGSGVISTYQMAFAFDGEFNEEAVDLDSVSSDDLQKLFNVIEAIAFFSSIDDVTLEAVLIGSGSTFGVYKADSLERSTTAGTVQFYINNTAAGVEQVVKNWISFTATFGGVDLTFKIWISNVEFLADYPNTYFVKVVYPGSPSKLLSGNYTSVIGTIADMSEYIIGESKTPVGAHDNTELYEFRSAYYPNGTTINDEVVIGVFYKGAEPTTQAVRVFIRNHLLSLSLATEATWREVLPDLFVDGRFFLIPCWHHYQALPGLIHPKGILPYTMIEDVLAAVFPALDLSWLTTRAQVLVAASSEFYLIAVPDDGNDSGDMSLVAEHPTYQPIDGSTGYFANMELKTQQFAISLANAMSVLTGAGNSEIFTEDEFYGRTFLSFVADSKEYHVLKRDSYPSII